MLQESPVKYGPLGDDVDETNLAWTRKKKPRKYIPQSSSSDAPTATAQDPISHALFGAGEASKDHQGPISDMVIVQEQDHALPPRTESGEEEETQELFGPHVIISKEDHANDTKKLAPDVLPLDSMMNSMSWTEKCEVLARHARHRITYHKWVKPDSKLELKHPFQYTEDELRKHGYFEYLENDECFEWFFHTDDILNPDLDDYQKITLKGMMHSRPEYLDVYEYHDCYHTYEMDAVFVKYYGEISKKIKWIKEYIHLDEKSVEWIDMTTRGWRQALRIAIATKLPHMTRRLASFAYTEYIFELREDAALKDLDLVYFEIWKLVVKKNKDYIEAVTLVKAKEKYHMHERTMEAEVNNAPAFVTMRQRIYGIVLQGDIAANTEDDKAMHLFREGVARLKIKNMVKYAEKKMEIAEVLNLHKRIDVS